VPAYDRALLLGPKRNEVLGLEEVVRYGRESFADPDYVSSYGLRPADWYGKGVRLLGRTVVECTRDRLGDLIGQDIARLASEAPGAVPVVVDPFGRLGEHALLDQATRPGKRCRRLRVRPRRLQRD